MDNIILIMANVTETSNFDEGVYQLETTDSLEGGQLGVLNKASKNLANRTKWLYDNLKLTLFSKELVLTSFTLDRNYSISTGLNSNYEIKSATVFLKCKIANNGYQVGDIVTAPTPYPTDSGRTEAQGLGVQFNNNDPSVLKIMINIQLTIMKPYTSASGATTDPFIISGSQSSNWSLILDVNYKLK